MLSLQQTTTAAWTYSELPPGSATEEQISMYMLKPAMADYHKCNPSCETVCSPPREEVSVHVLQCASKGQRGNAGEDLSCVRLVACMTAARKHFQLI